MNKYFGFSTTLGNQAATQAATQAAGTQAPPTAVVNPQVGVILAPPQKQGMFDGPAATSFKEEFVAGAGRGAGEELGATGMRGLIATGIARIRK
jgi:hypothetical protein